MASYRIAVIPGDGIGKEVVPEGIRVLEAAGSKYGVAFEFDELPWSCEVYANTGRMMPEVSLPSLFTCGTPITKALPTFGGSTVIIPFER